MCHTTFPIFLQQELPPINSAIENAVNSMPASCRKIAFHIIRAGGKRLRPCLVVLCARMFGHVRADVYNLAATMELLHAATLLHDDILDNADLRRNRKTAHNLFGKVQTILAGDAMLAMANSIVASFNMPALCQCFSHATYSTAAGEIQEMEILGNPELSESEYLEMIKGKTACLIADSCLLGAILANADKNSQRLIQDFGENLGMAFQIIDDVLDFLPDAQSGKPLGGDLREGKLTLPIRLYRNCLDQNRRTWFDEKFRCTTFTEEDIQELITSIEPYAEISRSHASTFLEKALFALRSFPDSKEKRILTDIVKTAESRTK